MRRKHIDAAFRAALKEHERTSVSDVWDKFADMFPDQVEVDARRLVTVGGKRAIRDFMRSIGNLDESDPDAPQLALALPGDPAPGFLTIQEGEDEVVVPFQKARHSDFLKAIDRRKKLIKDVRKRTDDLTLKLRYLSQFPTFASGEAVVEDVLASTHAVAAE